VTLLVDASALVAQVDAGDPVHGEMVQALRGEPGELVVPSFVACEADHLILHRFGVEAELAFLRDLATGVFTIADAQPRDLVAILGLAERYRDLELGLADASIVVLAERLDTVRVLTTDHRRFRAVTPLQGGSFTLLPADG
jgi:predicted nucleic acid-binding protein